MKKVQTGLILLASLVALALLLASCASPPQMGIGKKDEPVAAMEQPAAGTSGDTLAACKARIPKDASAGQRMIAEESCKRDAAARASIDAVPGQ